MTSTFGKMIDPAHKCMAPMLGYCWTLDTGDGWQGVAALACAKLTERAHISLAWAALSRLIRDRAVAIAESVLGDAGAPNPALLAAQQASGLPAAARRSSRLARPAIASMPLCHG